MSFWSVVPIPGVGEEKAVLKCGRYVRSSELGKSVNRKFSLTILREVMPDPWGFRSASRVEKQWIYGLNQTDLKSTEPEPHKS